jgi:uncharacterized membrane protein YqiK
MDDALVPVLIPVVVAISSLAVLCLGLTLFYGRCYKKIEQGHALIVNKMNDVSVFFTGGLVFPWVHRAEVIDTRVKTIVIERTGKDGVICRDNLRADIAATFVVRVNKTAQDVLKVAQTVGCARAGDQVVLEELFAARFSEALKTVAKRLDFEELHADRGAFRDEVLALIGQDLQGYVLDDLVLDRLEQTPASCLDPDNILDAEGLRKITERTTQEKVRRNELQMKAERDIRRAQAELEELIIEQERTRAGALGDLRRTTGRALTDRDLQERIDERLRALVRPVIVQVLAAQAVADELVADGERVYEPVPATSSS